MGLNIYSTYEPLHNNKQKKMFEIYLDTLEKPLLLGKNSLYLIWVVFHVFLFSCNYDLWLKFGVNLIQIRVTFEEGFVLDFYMFEFMKFEVL